ncbi:MAG TPA: glycosyltransferase [Rhodanobacteraceae bacterium]|nr:glycosyltransferase [Rhodanobacteraceae bacterium]
MPDPIVCICGSADSTWLEALRADLPAGATLRLLDLSPAHSAATLAAEGSGADIVAVAANALLPPFWLARLLHALHQPQVVAVQPLDASQLPGVAAPTSPTQLATLDRQCFLRGSRAALDAAGLAAPVLALRAGTRPPAHASELAAALARQGRVLQLEDLLVASPQAQAAYEGDERPVLARAVAQATRHASGRGYPGVDGKPVLLHIVHGWGGGAARWIDDLAAADHAHHHLVLRALGSFARRRHGEAFELQLAGDPLPLRTFRPAVPITSTAISSADYRLVLDRVIADFAVDAVLVSSLIGHSLDALRSGLPALLVVHDHYPLWPLLHRDFGDPQLAFDSAQLGTELAEAGDEFEFAERSPGFWRSLREAFVQAALASHATLVAPTASAMAAELRLAPALRDLPRNIVPHGLAPWPPHDPLPPPPARSRLRLLVPGRIRRGKGEDLLRAALPGLRRHADIVLLGAGAAGMGFFGQAGVNVVLDYRRDDLPRLLATFAPDAALLLSTVAETFSYALSEMRSLGLPVIATRLGAFAERIDDGVDGLLVDPRPDALVAAVAALAGNRGPLDAIRDKLRSRQVEGLEPMAAAYRGLLPLSPPPGVRYRCATASIDALAARAAEQTALGLRDSIARREAEYEQQAAELRKRTEWAVASERELRDARAALVERNAQYDALDAEMQQRTRWAQSLDAEVAELTSRGQELTAQRDELGGRIDELLRSRSWRWTRPLRTATTRYRSARASVKFRLARLKSLRGRLRGSLGRRGLAGTLARIRDEFAQRQPTIAPTPQPAPAEAFAPFAVPASATPLVSIVIPVHNKVAYTTACLRSLARHAGKLAFETILVDDASTDATAEQLAQIDGIRTLRNQGNIGFVGSCNAGAAVARGDYLVFLNNDTLVHAGWLEALLDCFARCPHAGLVGARLVYADGRLQEAGGIVFSDGSGWNYGRFGHPDDPRYLFRRAVDYCSGACIMLPRVLFEQLGGFDSRYAPGYYEDTDLAFAVRAAGRQVLYEPRARITHFEGISAGTDTASGMKRYQVVNHRKFLAKWGDALRRQPAPVDEAADAHLAATHSARWRVLIVDASTPTPDQDSGSVRLLNIMRLLRDMGCQVTFLPDNLASIDGYTAQLQAEGIETVQHPFVADMPAFYRARGREFDLVMISRHYVAAHHVGLVRAHAPRARLVFDTVDLHYLRERRAAELDPRPELRRQAEATRAQELKLIRECDVTLVVSRVEKALLAADAPGARVEVLSNVHPVFGSRQPFERRRDLLFVGGFQHPPNIDAMLWFCAEVMPRVRRALPELRLHLVGSKMPESIRALASDAVEVHGFVEDIEPLLDGCRISVAPLRYGAGVKGKVNMAMSYGLPVVATPMAVEGIDAEPGREVLVAADAEGFAEAVVRLYGNPALWQQLSRNGAESVRRQFSFEVARATLRGLLGGPDSGLGSTDSPAVPTPRSHTTQAGSAS